jgi:hypothetical protein
MALIATVVLISAAILAASGSGSTGMRDEASVRSERDVPPLRASVLFPHKGAKAGVGGTFSVDLSIQARTRTANSLLSGYTSHFIDPNSPEFHPGSNASAPGLVVLLSTTPNIPGTPLQGPNTNLAGVFQINDVERLDGLKRSFNSWLVGVPGFFGQRTQATLTVYAVQGTAPNVISDLIPQPRPISNVVHRTFTIAG